MPGADDCWTDHRLLISRLNFMTQRPPRRTPDNIPHRRFDCDKLRNPQLAQNDGTISLLIEAKRQTRLILENQPTAENKRTHKQAVADCQRGIREVQNTWWQRKAADIQNYADQRDLR
ncbi:hypothetical protein Pcinc_036239 [Petrolisthes cinctipes]|uniref:Uncharacterized protein n=1 Tax=Petrolisthes cinctipes TaxID=88211 RepID=A0AAE1BVA1_PETCI|nr:hypothetical protein Pcinc_036239 [Petrolisthes cinctipes]